jgi:hypothetical protein
VFFDRSSPPREIKTIKRQQTKHVTSDPNFEKTLAKRTVNMEKRLLRNVLLKKPRRAPSDKGDCLVHFEDSDEHTLLWFMYFTVQNGSGAHPASYPMGTGRGGSFPGGRATGA